MGKCRGEAQMLSKRTRDTGNSEEATHVKQQISIPEVIRSEVNFLVLPFFALWDKDVRSRTKSEYITIVKRGTQKLEVLWRVTSDPEYGYPGPFDREVHKAIEQIISEFPIPIRNPIPIGSLYNLCKRMGISSFGGSQYRKIKDALERITTTSIKSGGTFYSKEKKEWIEEIFHLYERVVFKGRALPNGNIADTNYLYLNSWYLDNINANYVKPIDWEYYKYLENPIAQRLYELLSVKFYGLLIRKGSFLSYKYSTICELLPITRQKYLSLAKKILDPSHEKLRETGFLTDWDWDETPSRGDNDWLIKYYPGKRAKEEIEKFSLGEQLELELPPHRYKEATEDKTELPAETLNITEQLTQRGITQATARELAKNYAISQIQKQIEVFDWLVEKKSPLLQKNPSGFLRKSIEDNYQPPKEYHDNQNRKDREQKEKDRQERWMKHREEMIKQDIADWDTIPPAERVAGRLGFWLAGEKINNRQPTEEQIEAMRQELIDNLPKTDEEKWEHLCRNYPEDPPEDFE